MPFTPFHLGPALLIGLLALRWLDFPTLLVASVLVDVRTTLVFFGVLTGPLHGPLHTFLGSALLGGLLIAATIPGRPSLDAVLARFRVPQATSRRRIAAGAFVGVWLHVALDATLYADMAPLVPVPGNPLLGLVGLPMVYIGCTVAGILGCGLYAVSAVGAVTLSADGPE